ncbi:MAG: hypothetical protein J5934_01810 [Succinivibrio sp.]|nr:hypothetical protein [Succinivibrio sp.]
MVDSAKRPVVFSPRDRIRAELSAFFSRCGVPYDDIEYGEFIEDEATVTYSINWKFKPDSSDKVIRNVAAEEKVLSENDLARYTENSMDEQMANMAGKRDDFIKYIKMLSIDDLHRFCSTRQVISEKHIIGKVKKGAANLKKLSKQIASVAAVCPTCMGKGRIVCPTCGGTDPTCKKCHGANGLKCPDCQGTGKYIPPKARSSLASGRYDYVDRSIGVYGDGEDGFLFHAHDIDGLPKLILSPREKELVIKDTQMELESAELLAPNHYRMLFSAKVKCYRQPLQLYGYDEKAVYTAIGDSLRPVCKPPLLDKLFEKEANVINYTVRTDRIHDADQKIKCCQTIASKALLTKTLRSVESAYDEAMGVAANKFSVNVYDLLDSEMARMDPVLAEAIEYGKRKQTEVVKQKIVEQANRFVSNEFAENLSSDLIDFMPVLSELNPNAKTVWGVASVFTWTLIFIILMIFSSHFAYMFCFFFSVIVAIFISFKITKNMPFFHAASALQLKRNGRPIPDIGPEAVNSARLILVTVIIESIMYLIWS